MLSPNLNQAGVGTVGLLVLNASLPTRGPVLTLKQSDSGDTGLIKDQTPKEYAQAHPQPPAKRLRRRGPTAWILARGERRLHTAENRRREHLLSGF